MAGNARALWGPDGTGWGLAATGPAASIRARRPQALELSLAELLATIGFSLQPGASRRREWPATRLPPGRWTPPLYLRQFDLTILVVSGALLRRCPYGVDVLLRGDVSRVGSAPGERWRVLSPSASVAVLTSKAIAALAAVPGAAHALLLALRAQHERSLALRSIACRYDVRERIVRLFAYLAARVGRPDGEGARIALDLEQKRIEEIVGAGHTQATAAFRMLFDAGVLVRDAGGWLFLEARWRAPEPHVAS